MPVVTLLRHLIVRDSLRLLAWHSRLEVQSFGSHHRNRTEAGREKYCHRGQGRFKAVFCLTQIHPGGIRDMCGPDLSY